MNFITKSSDTAQTDCPTFDSSRCRFFVQLLRLVSFSFQVSYADLASPKFNCWPKVFAFFIRKPGQGARSRWAHQRAPYSNFTIQRAVRPEELSSVRTLCGLQFVNHLTFSNNPGHSLLKAEAFFQTARSHFWGSGRIQVFSALEPSVWVSALSLSLSLSNRKPDSQFDFVKCICSV